MSETKHTPTPWHVGPHYKSDIESRVGRVCDISPMNAPQSIANAEFIVRACNSHEELLILARGLVAWHDARFVQNLGEPFAALVDAARTAILKAEGK